MKEPSHESTSKIDPLCSSEPYPSLSGALFHKKFVTPNVTLSECVPQMHKNLENRMPHKGKEPGDHLMYNRDKEKHVSSHHCHRKPSNKETIFQ